MYSRHAADDAPMAGTIAEQASGALAAFDILLQPVSHPELGDIRIDDNLFAVGRTETPFASYPPDIVADLSRRHARIFCEHGAVYLADLGSKNGTTVNGVDIRQKTGRLHDGDAICFGGTLSYRVRFGTRAAAPGRVPKVLGVTLQPERGDLGLQPIVVTRFPFLISKTDAAFARYRDAHPHQVNYLSRRHAHIFVKGGAAFVEDLGSTNGTFVSGKRLDEHAVPLHDGDALAFGGHHFAYRVSLQKEDAVTDPTVTTFSAPASPATHGIAQDAAGDADKTTFVAAAASFLDIFCIDQEQQQDDEPNPEALQAAGDAARETGKRRPRGRAAIFLSELAEAFAGSDRSGMRRAFWWGMSLLALTGMLAFVLYRGGAPERDLKDMLASGDYAQAATVASQYLARDPDNAEFKAAGTEALLKANVPKWLVLLRAREFERAAAVIADMQRLGSHNADAQPLVSELAWIGGLEQFVIGRGGVEAPIRIYADEDRIKALLQRWNENTQEHQRAFVTISSYVPAFRDRYAEALSHLRKLQSDDAVYLAAIGRLKTAIGTALSQDRPETLEAVLKDYAEKYPRLGLDSVRQDWRQYMAIDNQARARRLGPLVAALAKARFVTPPFQAGVQALTASGRLPPAAVVRQYAAVANAWREGNTGQAFDGLRRMAAGPWADAAATETAHKQALLEQFTALQKARGTTGYEDRLLAFYGALDPGEDVYFLRAVDADIGRYRDQALKQAQELLGRAGTRWNSYRQGGAIGGEQRLDATISKQFRTQAGLLAAAEQDARQGLRIYTQLKTAPAAPARKLADEVIAEAESQRKALQELRNVLEPALLKQKLALLGDRNDGERQSTETAD